MISRILSSLASLAGLKSAPTPAGEFYTPQAERKCPHCGKTIKGRADKKYCSLACQNAAAQSRWRANHPIESREYKKGYYLANRSKILKRMEAARKAQAKK
jgi:endogenous inhibitor of DNA gyrase (YacG/DUF329 family)